MFILFLKFVADDESRRRALLMVWTKYGMHGNKIDAAGFWRGGARHTGWHALISY
jgi:hypothetical protein